MGREGWQLEEGVDGWRPVTRLPAGLQRPPLPFKTTFLLLPPLLHRCCSNRSPVGVYIHAAWLMDPTRAREAPPLL